MNPIYIDYKNHSALQIRAHYEPSTHSTVYALHLSSCKGPSSAIIEALTDAIKCDGPRDNFLLTPGVNRK